MITAAAKLRFVSAEVLSQAVSDVARPLQANEHASTRLRSRTKVRASSAFFKPRERNKRKMLLRTARAAPRLLRTAPRHKSSSVAALHDDDDATTRATIAKVVSRYARTQEQLVPWFLEQMPRSYFALVPESSQLAHLQAAAGAV